MSLRKANDEVQREYNNGGVYHSIVDFTLTLPQTHDQSSFFVCLVSSRAFIMKYELRTRSDSEQNQLYLETRTLLEPRRCRMPTPPPTTTSAFSILIP